MKIEVLFVPNCPNHRVAVDRVREVLSTEGLQLQINEILVRDADMAQVLKFPGSPTVRINGADVEPSAHESGFGIMCRIYAGGTGAPSQQSLRAAMKRENTSA